MARIGDRPWVADDDDSQDWQLAAPPADALPAEFLGTVTVNYISTAEDRWTAVWERAGEHLDFDGSYSDTIAWVRSQKASAYLVFDTGLGDFVPRTASELD